MHANQEEQTSMLNNVCLENALTVTIKKSYASFYGTGEGLRFHNLATFFSNV